MTIQGLIVSAALVTLLNAETIAAENEPISRQKECSIGAFSLGTPFNRNAQRVRRSRAKTYSKPRGTGRIYRVLDEQGPYKLYLHIVNGRIARIIREFEGTQAGHVYKALEEKYGEPDASGSLVPDMKSNYSPIGGSIKLENRVFWRDFECRHVIEFVKQSKTSISVFAGGTRERVGVIWSISTVDPDSASNSLVD